MIFPKPNKNSSGIEVGMNRMFPSVEKTRLSKPRHFTIHPLFRYFRLLENRH
jgi:hypothetical protein